MDRPSPTSTPEARFRRWLAAAERRHAAGLTFPEIRRGLQALSSVYVERRRRLRTGAALDGAGKRAAFALFFAPIHYLVVAGIVERLALGRTDLRRIHDVGCGTGAAGAAWAAACDPVAEVSGVDVNRWAVGEARRTYADLGIPGRARTGKVRVDRLPGGAGNAIVAGWFVNELDDPARDAILRGLIEHARSGTAVLVVEPIARRPLPWWDAWTHAFAAEGGRADVWKWSADLPDLIERLDRAARLDHRTLSARSLSLAP